MESCSRQSGDDGTGLPTQTWPPGADGRASDEKITARVRASACIVFAAGRVSVAELASAAAVTVMVYIAFWRVSTC